MNYLRERKIIGRNDESMIINGLQYLLVVNHDVKITYLHEKRSKKTIKFRIPYSLDFGSTSMSMEELCQYGEDFLVKLGVYEKNGERDKSQRRIQRSRESEVNAGILCIFEML